jgi:hypothetical protein
VSIYVEKIAYINLHIYIYIKMSIILLFINTPELFLSYPLSSQSHSTTHIECSVSTISIGEIWGSKTCPSRIFYPRTQCMESRKTRHGSTWSSECPTAKHVYIYVCDFFKFYFKYAIIVQRERLGKDWGERCVCVNLRDKYTHKIFKVSLCYSPHYFFFF